MQRRGWLLLAATALGLAIAWMDARPGWDDTEISAGLLLIGGAVFGAASPKHAWQWALAIGLWIPLNGFLRLHNYGAALAILPAMLGAYAGAGLRSVAFPHAGRA